MSPFRPLLVVGLVLMVAAPVQADAPKEGEPNARQAAEAYLAAALAGKVKEAAALGVPGKKAAAEKSIKELNQLVGPQPAAVTEAYASDKKGRGIVVTEAVKLAKANPDGKDTRHLILEIEKVGGKWRVKEVDVRPEENAKDLVKRFKEKYEDATEVK